MYPYNQMPLEPKVFGEEPMSPQAPQIQDDEPMPPTSKDVDETTSQ
ncbi:MAG: hypothetical protein LBQ59_03205 [Candidatus Peribacteria bacterium]|jgi:hypothetical protein|nr:hypothetical protein [Candidatus Peribacteria bacterium]